MELTVEDFNILIEAMEAWERESQSSGMVAGMLGLMISKDQESGKTLFDETMRNAENKKKERTELATCLKAKLILMKNNLSEKLPSSSQYPERTQSP